MIIARSINNGDCPECGKKQSLVVAVIREDDLVYGDVSCIKCHVWITDLMLDELLALGVDTLE